MVDILCNFEIELIVLVATLTCNFVVVVGSTVVIGLLGRVLDCAYVLSFLEGLL